MSLVWFYWIKTTSKNRTIRSPLLLASGIGWTSRTFVRKANLPSLLQANHVPPASPSRPPSISPPCHHARASVGLQKNKQPHKFKTYILLMPSLVYDNNSEPSILEFYFSLFFWWVVLSWSQFSGTKRESEKEKEEEKSRKIILADYDIRLCWATEGKDKSGELAIRILLYTCFRTFPPQKLKSLTFSASKRRHCSSPLNIYSATRGDKNLANER